MVQKPIKLRNRISVTDIYYTYPQWPSKEIDGVTFIPVVKNVPSNNEKQIIYYMRKEALEKTK